MEDSVDHWIQDNCTRIFHKRFLSFNNIFRQSFPENIPNVAKNCNLTRVWKWTLGRQNGRCLAPTNGFESIEISKAGFAPKLLDYWVNILTLFLQDSHPGTLTKSWVVLSFVAVKLYLSALLANTRGLKTKGRVSKRCGLSVCLRCHLVPSFTYLSTSMLAMFISLWTACRYLHNAWNPLVITFRTKMALVWESKHFIRCPPALVFRWMHQNMKSNASDKKSSINFKFSKENGSRQLLRL